MPIYRYVCTKCGHEFTVFHGMNERPEIRCEKCGGKAEKVIGRVGVIFKGSGFYTTDSRKSESKKTENKHKKSEKSNNK